MSVSHVSSRSRFFPSIDDKARFVIMDMETTGKKPMTKEMIKKQPKAWKAPGLIIEIGCIELIHDSGKWSFGEKFHHYINPEGPIEPQAVKIHQIKSGDLVKSPKFRDIAEEFIAFIGDDPIVAHAYENEKGFIDYEFMRNHVEEDVTSKFIAEKFLCTQRMYDELFDEGYRSLDSICDRLWIDRTERFDGHGALLDAQLTAVAFAKMWQMNETDCDPQDIDVD